MAGQRDWAGGGRPPLWGRAEPGPTTTSQWAPGRPRVPLPLPPPPPPARPGLTEETPGQPGSCGRHPVLRPLETSVRAGLLEKVTGRGLGGGEEAGQEATELLGVSF